MRGQEVLQTAATVVYVSPGLGMGVRFDEKMSEDQLVTLDRWLTDAFRTT